MRSVGKCTSPRGCSGQYIDTHIQFEFERITLAMTERIHMAIMCDHDAVKTRTQRTEGILWKGFISSAVFGWRFYMPLCWAMLMLACAYMCICVCLWIHFSGDFYPNMFSFFSLASCHSSVPRIHFTALCMSLCAVARTRECAMSDGMRKWLNMVKFSLVGRFGRCGEYICCSPKTYVCIRSTIVCVTKV